MKCPQCRSENPAPSLFCGRCGARLASASGTAESPSDTLPMGDSLRILKRGDLFANKYLIGGEIGRGGMGIVLKAEDVRLKRPVALKLLAPELSRSPEARERFVREAQAAAALDHPNICTVYEVEERDGRTYIAMAFVEGQSLKDKAAAGPLLVSEVLEIALQVAQGLVQAHGKGIVHRDIKPANVMVTPNGQAKIMDFGLARLGEISDLTRTSVVMGTIAYMSPEQAQGLRVDHRTDLWSFGCLLYELFAGRGPFGGGPEQSVLHTIIHDDPPPLAGLRPDVPAGVAEIVGRCLGKNPEDRYPDAASLVDALKSVDLAKTASAGSSPARREPPSVAVLPFSDLSPGRDQEYFGEGIAEEIIHALARIREFRVVARTSAFALKGMNLDVREIGRRLNVKAVLEGSVRKSGDRLRITAQLIDVRDGYHLWSERFDRQAADVFAIQDEIALAIVNHLEVTLRVGEKTALRKRSTDDPEVYNLYLKGLYFAARTSPEAFEKALVFFRKALDRDPNYAPAYAGIGRVFGSQVNMGLAPATELWPKAKTLLDKALSLDKDLAEAHVLVAVMALYFEWDWAAAEASFRRSLALNPGDAFARGTYAWFLFSRRRFEEALREVRQAVALDPLIPVFQAWAVGIPAAAGMPDEALREFARAVEIDPGNGLAYFHAGIAHMQKGQFDQAIEALEQAGRLGISPGWTESNIGVAYQKKGDLNKARKVWGHAAASVTANPSFVTLAFGAASQGDFDKAFEFFKQGRETRDVLMPFVNVYIDLYAPELRRDPRFGRLISDLNLADVD